MFAAAHAPSGAFASLTASARSPRGAGGGVRPWRVIAPWRRPSLVLAAASDETRGAPEPRVARSRPARAGGPTKPDKMSRSARSLIASLEARRARRETPPGGDPAPSGAPSTSSSSDPDSDALADADPERGAARTRSNAARARGGHDRGRKSKRPPAKPPPPSPRRAASPSAPDLASRRAGRRRSSARRGGGSSRGDRSNGRLEGAPPTLPARDAFGRLASDRAPLTASEEAELSEAIQQLLRVEAMARQLEDAAVAEELRAGGDVGGGAGAGAAGEGVLSTSSARGDVFSKDFGKRTASASPRGLVSSSSRAPRLVSTSPASRSALARAMGYDSVASLRDVELRGESARRVFVSRNSGFVRQVVSKIHATLGTGDKGIVDRDDLFQEGCAALVEAANRFDPSKGYKFSTYAYHWIRKAALRAVGDHGRTIRLPAHVRNDVAKLRNARRAMRATLGREATVDELAAALGTSAERVGEYERWAATPLSIDGESGGGFSDASDGAPLLDGAVFATAEREAEDGVGRAVVDADFMRQDIEEALATLLPREAFVLRHRFGLASAAGKALGSGSYDDENDWLRATPEEAEEALRRAREAHRSGASEEGRREKKKKKNAPRGGGASFSKPGEHGGASRPLLGSLLGVSAETVRTIERRAVAKLKQPHRAGLVTPWLDPETLAALEESGDEAFAAALAESIEKAERKARFARTPGPSAAAEVGEGNRNARSARRRARKVKVAPRRGGNSPPGAEGLPRDDEPRKVDEVTIETSA